MIKVNDNWAILVDDLCYSPVRLDRTKKDKRTPDKAYYRRIGYYATLEGALNRIAEEMTKAEFKDASVSLREATAIIQKCYGDIMGKMEQ